MRYKTDRWEDVWVLKSRGIVEIGGLREDVDAQRSREKIHPHCYHCDFYQTGPVLSRASTDFVQISLEHVNN